MEKLTNYQLKALEVLLSKKVDSLHWYAGQCHTEGDFSASDKYTKDAIFWEEILEKLK